MEKYLVVGAGRSGICSANMLFELGKDFVIYDSKPDLDTSAVKEKLSKKDAVPFILGDIGDTELQDISVCVVSPGVPLTTPVMTAVINRGIPVWSEIELAYRYDKGSVIGITGTNGKTTTTALTHKIVKRWKEDSLLVGNIEIPYTGLALTSKQGGVTIAEISSFQLETMLTFKPKVSAILNITPDHLDRHGTMENYIEVKKSITVNQDKDDYCILNYEDEVLREFGKSLPCKVVFFSSRRRLDDGFYYENGGLYIAEKGEHTLFMSTEEIKLVGLHNFENIMAAAAMSKCIGVPLDTIRQVIRTFTAVEHRIEFVCQKNGVKYYNDSKGTNTDASIKAVDAMPSQTVLIAGGYDKKSEYDEWASHFPGKVKKLILIGQTKENIAATCDKIGFKDYCFASSLEEAVRLSAEAACEGDCCLLSPACASWGMFKNYQQRGTMFKELVKAL